MRIALFRRRQCWLPTVWGLLLLIGATGLVCGLAARNVYSLLAVTEPAQSARVLVVEGWASDKDLDQAVAVFRSGQYARVVTTGGPVVYWLKRDAKTTYAQLAADYLRTHGLAHADITAVPAPESAQDRTYLSAVHVRDWALRQPGTIDAIDLFSAGTHARRSLHLYRKAFGPRVQVGMISARPSEYDPERWWGSSAGAKAVLGETIGLAWTLCCFFPPAPGSHEERWGVPK